ncbi:MAG: hypothetical protein OET44_10185 [Gammaproteobacteria bacterium]|nr:hypothetical protein [Gammaproteobacteria bacterium]
MAANDKLFAEAPQNACPAYTNLRNATDGPCRSGREHCEDLWNDFALLADKNFLVEFPVRFHQRWFEMYLTVALMRLGMAVQCPKPGPDILVTVDGRRVWIEAVCASPGAAGKPDSVPEPEYVRAGDNPIVSSVPKDQMVLRLRNSLAEKQTQYQRYLDSGIVNQDDILAVAINVHAVHGLWANMGDIVMRALYGVGDLVVSLDRNTGTIVSSHHAQVSSIEKKLSGAQVGVEPFTDSSMPHIAAVLGSRADAVNLPQRLGDDCALYPNLSSMVSWRPNTIRFGEEWTFVESDEGWDGSRTSHKD